MWEDQKRFHIQEHCISFIDDGVGALVKKTEWLADNAFMLGRLDEAERLGRQTGIDSGYGVVHPFCGGLLFTFVVTDVTIVVTVVVLTLRADGLYTSDADIARYNTNSALFRATC